MRRGVWIVLAALAVAAPAFADDEQVDCGEFTNNNTSHQLGSYAWLEYIVETRPPVTMCLYYVEVGRIVNVDGSAAFRDGPLHGFGQATGAGARLGPIPDQRKAHANPCRLSLRQRRHRQPRGRAAAGTRGLLGLQRRDAASGTRESHGVWRSWAARSSSTRAATVTGSSVKNGVHFDLNADGTPELTAWTRRDSDDAFPRDGPQWERPG